MMIDLHTKKTLITILISLMLVITFVSFYPSLENNFTNWDDEGHIIENPFIKSLKRENLKALPDYILLGNYIPLTTLTYMLEYRFFKLNPSAYHTTNLILHLLNCILIFWFIYLISNEILIAFVVSLLFGIHPLHVESVAWISERKDVLYALFFIGSLIAYWYYLKKELSYKYFYLSILLYLASLLSKPMAFSLPFLLFLIDYYTWRRFNARVFFEKIPFFVLTIPLVIITFHSQQEAITHKLIFMFPDNVLYLCYRFIFYLEKLILPVNLSCLYPYPEKISGVLPLIYRASPAILIALITFTVIILKRFKWDRSIVFGILFFIITLLPVIQIVPAGRAVTADRYTYLPYTGLFFIGAKAFFYILRKKLYLSAVKILFVCLFIVSIGALCFLTWHRCLVWKDSISLWTDVISKYPGATLAYNNRGKAYFARGELNRAAHDYQQAIKTNRNDYAAYANLCETYLKQGKLRDAFESCKMAVTIKPDCFEALNSLGNIYRLLGRNGEAVDLYTKVLEIKPDYAPAYYNLCRLFQDLGKYNHAIVFCRKALSVKQDFIEAYENLGNIYFSLNNKNEAIEMFKKALEINQNYAPVHNNLAVLYFYEKQYNIAVSHYEKAIELGYNVHREFSDLIKPYCSAK